ncbi:hypothetical protein DC429_10195 [Arthrobacter sp. TPD3018]|uniref:hypothetical protein n=1 Tax=Bacteria TaxID=2 RepID=UPI000D523968|nr:MULTISPECIES: hypothetical protein [Bacteria]PVE57741.1 hypothetical protein DC425_07815 [Sphingomonas sp. TPD3009]PVE58655.1 hypothetical protein DC429_10195 [Arthrobacter sp. TPD3018]PVE86177.1 hypothetical protein DC431_10185 [Sphingomonas melonis]
MSSGDDDQTISRQPEFTFRAELTPEQIAFFREWDAAVPTLYFMDICVANIAKVAGPTPPTDPRKAAWLDELRRLDRPQHAFSYLLALMEKGSDPRAHLPDEALADQISQDLASLRTFFSQARVYESNAMVALYLRELRGNPVELARPRYLAFLRAANEEFELHRPLARRLRLAQATKILERADALGVSRQHLTVAVVLACLYGNPHAINVMKFKPDPQRFAAENALADVMMIRRFMEQKLELEKMAAEGRCPYLRVKLLTDDEGVRQLARYFEPSSLRSRSDGGGRETRLVTNVQFLKLLTDLAVDRQKRSAMSQHTDDHERDEFDALCTMILGGTESGA